MSDRNAPGALVPGAVTVAVTSGKGGVGKTSTTVALAIALADQGVDVVVIDADLGGPNVHLLSDVADLTLGVDKPGLSLTLPRSSHGFRVATSASIAKVEPTARVTVTDLIGLAQFADPSQVVLVDLPPGWTEHHDSVCRTLPDLVFAVVAPTLPAISDHARHVKAWNDSWRQTVTARRGADKRRKLDLPEAPTLIAVETMAKFTGIPEHGGDPVTVRRLDAVPTEQMAEHVSPLTSIPAAGSLRDSAAGPEVAQLAKLVTELL